MPLDAPPGPIYPSLMPRPLLDIHATIRDRMTALGLRNVDVARRCQERVPRSPRHWEAQVSRLLGPASDPRPGNVELPTLALILTVLDMTIVPLEENRQDL